MASVNTSCQKCGREMSQQKAPSTTSKVLVRAGRTNAWWSGFVNQIVVSTSQARAFYLRWAAAKTLIQDGHVTPPNLPKSGRFLISVLYAIKGGVAKYNMSLSCMNEPLEMPKRNK